ncbi:MAG TPA: GTP-binding protein [Abditibacterium sp.]|jgi:G3E family GTPase
MKTRLSVALISGFLGAGKTTFVRHVIRDAAARGLKVGLVINEFGAADIDSILLRDSGADLLGALAGGCACCSSQDEMIWTMLRLGRLPREEQPDVVLLEASGLADPLVMLDGLSVEVLRPLVRVASVVCLVDAPRLLELQTSEAQIAPLLKRQLALADLVVVSKIDVAFRGEKATQQAVAETTIRAENPQARLEWARSGAISLDAFWKRVLEADFAYSAPDAGAAEHGQTQTLVVPMPKPMLRERVEALLRNLPPQVWRVKGFVRIVGENDLFLVQLSGGAERQLEISRFEADFNRLPPAELVFIGPSLNESSLRRGFGGTASLVQA